MSRRAHFLPLAAMFFLHRCRPDVTFCPSVTEAFFSPRRSDEDQHAGNRPFRSFHHLPLREKLRKSSAPSALLSAGGSAGLQDNNQSLQEKVKITTCLSSTKLKIPRLKFFTDIHEHCPVQFRFEQLSQFLSLLN